MDDLISDLLIDRAQEILNCDLSFLRGKTFRYLYREAETRIFIAFMRDHDLRKALPAEFFE